MPRRPHNQNKNLPKFLQPGVEKFEHWGRRIHEIFPDELTSPSPIHPAIGSSSQSEAESIQFIEYRPCEDNTSRDSLDELPPFEPCTNHGQPSSSSSFYHQRSRRAAQNTSRSTTNDLTSRPPRRSLRQRESRQPRHRTRVPGDDLEASQPSPYNDSSSSNASFPTSLRTGSIIELTDVDRCTSAASVQGSVDYFPSEPRTIKHPIPVSSSRSPQRTVFSEPSPISPSAGANGSLNITPFQRPASNLGSQTGSLLHGMDPFSPGHAVRANRAVAQYPSFPISEHPIPPNSNDANTLTSSTSSFTWVDPAHGSSSSLGPMAQHGYYNQNFSTCGETFFSPYYPSLDNCLPPSQPTYSADPQVYLATSIDSPVETHSTYPANSSLSHVRSLSLQTTSSSSQLAQTTQGYVTTFGVDANVQDTFFLPEMNYRTLPRSYDFQEQPHGLSQSEVYHKSQRSRHTSPGLSPTYASTGHNHFPNAVATSSVSRLEQKSSSSVALTDHDWYRTGDVAKPSSTLRSSMIPK